MEWKRYLVLFAVLLICGGAVWIGLAAMMAWSILRPPRMSAGKAIYHLRRLSPGDLDLPFEELTFTVRDVRSGEKLNIAGWWIPSGTASSRCVVLIHGYADAKVGAIAWAPLLHDLDLNILAIDLRAHGDSGGRFCTGGYFEREDVDQVINQLLNLYPHQTRQLFLFGISLGAAVACAVAARRDDITAMVLESPLTDYRKAVTTHTRLLHLPGGILLRAAIGGAQVLSGAKFDEIRPRDLLSKIRCRVLTIVGSDDELLDGEDFILLEKLSSDYWQVESAGHLQAMLVDPVGYLEKIRLFIAASQP